MTILILISTVLISLLAFNNETFLQKQAFHPYVIKRNGEWYRFVSGGFLHAGWLHLGLNMFVLYNFGHIVEKVFQLHFGKAGGIVFVVYYFLSIAVSHIGSYLKHKDNYYFRSIGASGAVAACIFTVILFFPSATIYPYGIPMKAVVFGILYLALEWYLGRRNNDMVNHDAHFWGALFGLLFPIIFEPYQALVFIHEIQGIFGR
jgi:membrane associated rhomboid family serine protease